MKKTLKILAAGGTTMGTEPGRPVPGSGSTATTMGLPSATILTSMAIA